MKLGKISWIALVVTILIALDGLYMTITHYQPKAVNNFGLSDGATILIGALFMFIITVVSVIIESRQSQRK
ncbi:hypothetical protein [Alicyclobacillus sp. SO9]|uniref:hypothetical protein n=1 Tax=Alicyclobacillus sp. SO9 TaxID=2665646 RepID=UPI0018E8DD8E|nr:hypothetical protein [Alicyclobacillus sp. SO9]QQE78210.1 hypothetical protein GI364_20355 [Alicyclobacillus sp. SO9]